MYKDYLARALVSGMRGFCAVTTNLVKEAVEKHDCTPVAASALGRLLTAGTLLAANFKNNESLTLRIAGTGPIESIVVDATAHGTVRGYVRNPYVDMPLKENGKLDVAGAVGSGNIYVTRFTGLKHPFTGSSELISGEIAEDITSYLLTSEQTPSSVSLGVLANSTDKIQVAGGFYIEVMPNAEDEVITTVENNLANLPSITTLLAEGLSPEDILKKIFAGLKTTFGATHDLHFRCICSKEKVINTLISLGTAEVGELIKIGQAEVRCHFCNTSYIIDKSELEEIFKDQKR